MATAVAIAGLFSSAHLSKLQWGGLPSLLPWCATSLLPLLSNACQKSNGHMGRSLAKQAVLLWTSQQGVSDKGALLISRLHHTPFIKLEAFRNRLSALCYSRESCPLLGQTSAGRETPSPGKCRTNPELKGCIGALRIQAGMELLSGWRRNRTGTANPNRRNRFSKK